MSSFQRQTAASSWETPVAQHSGSPSAFDSKPKFKKRTVTITRNHADGFAFAKTENGTNTFIPKSVWEGLNCPSKGQLVDVFVEKSTKKPGEYTAVNVNTTLPGVEWREWQIGVDQVAAKDTICGSNHHMLAYACYKCGRDIIAGDDIALIRGSCVWTVKCDALLATSLRQGKQLPLNEWKRQCPYEIHCSNENCNLSIGQIFYEPFPRDETPQLPTKRIKLTIIRESKNSMWLNSMVLKGESREQAKGRVDLLSLKDPTSQSPRPRDTDVTKALKLELEAMKVEHGEALRKNHVWKCYMGGKWVEYEADIQRDLYHAHLSKKKVELSIGRFKYEFDFGGDEEDGWHQVNVETNKRREIRRMPKDNTPPYWTNAWEEDKLCSPIPIENQAHLRLFSKALKTKWKLGVGRDVRQASPEDYTLEMKKVWRIENKGLWEQYAASKNVIRSQLNQIASERKTPDTTLKLDDFDEDLDHDLNEVFLFHGTKPDSVLKIMSTGGNERFSGVLYKGLYGDGLYFAEDSAKSDNYAEVDAVFMRENKLHQELYRNASDHPSNVFYMFVFRVTMGHFQTVKEGCKRRECDLIDGETESLGLPHHTLLADNPLHRFREFITYHGEYAYPEFLIAYQRKP